MEESGDIQFSSSTTLDNVFSTISLSDDDNSRHFASSQQMQARQQSPSPQRLDSAQPANAPSAKKSVEVKPADDDFFSNTTSDFPSMISPFHQEAPVAKPSFQAAVGAPAVQQSAAPPRLKPHIVEDEGDAFGETAPAPSPFSELIVGANQTGNPRALQQHASHPVQAQQPPQQRPNGVSQPQRQAMQAHNHGPMQVQLQPRQTTPSPQFPSHNAVAPPYGYFQPIPQQQSNGQLVSQHVAAPAVQQQQQQQHINSSPMPVRRTPPSHEPLDGIFPNPQQLQENHHEPPNLQKQQYDPMQNRIYMQPPTVLNPLSAKQQQQQQQHIGLMNPVAIQQQQQQQQQQQHTRSLSAFEQVSQGYTKQQQPIAEQSMSTPQGGYNIQQQHAFDVAKQQPNNFFKQPSPQLFLQPIRTTQPQVPQQQGMYEQQQHGFYSQSDNGLKASVQVDMKIRQKQIYNLDSLMARPVVAFGFGGKIAVLFPQRQQKLNVLDQSANNLPFVQRVPVKLFDLSSVLTQTQYVAGLQQFPGPLNAQTNRQDIAKFIDQVINRYQSDTYSGMLNPRTHAMTLLWKLLRIILGNDSLNEYALNKTVLEIKSMLLEHKKDNGSWLNNNQQHQQHYHHMSNNMDAPSQQDILQLEKLLLDGKIEDATQFAMQTRLWAHAMLLSVMIDKVTYQKVVTAFAQSSFPEGSPLRTLYMMFADRGDLLFHAATVSMDQHGNTFTSHSRQQQQSQQQQISKLCDNWEENLCMIIANRTATSGKVIEKLGDSLNKVHGVEAAHLCYLIGDYCCQLDLSQRLSLIGGDYKRDKRVTASAIQLTEIYEFCKQRLSQQPYLMQHLATFKLVYAFWLAEIGFTARAIQYADYLNSVFQQTRNIVSYGAYFTYQLHVLNHRLHEAQKWHIGEKKSSLLSSSSSSGGVTGWLASGLTRIIHGTAADDDAQSSPTAVKEQQQTLQPIIRPVAQQQQAQPAQQPQQQAQPAQQQTVTETKKSWWSNLFSFGGNKPRKEANIGQENKFEWNEKLKRWIPRGSNPADYEEEEAPPPPEMMSAALNEVSYDHSQSSSKGPNLHISSRYVAVGFGSENRTAQKTPVTPNGSLAPPSLLFGMNNVPTAIQPPSFFVPSPQPMIPATITADQPENVQQQPQHYGAASFHQPTFSKSSASWDQSFEPMQPQQHYPTQTLAHQHAPMAIGMQPVSVSQQPPYPYIPDQQQ